MTPRRKPPWLKLLCPPGVNHAHLTARRCGACREWVAVDTGGPIEEVYDPGVLDATDLATAIILGRRFTRIQPIAGTTLIGLRTPCGTRASNRTACTSPPTNASAHRSA